MIADDRLAKDLPRAVLRCGLGRHAEHLAAISSRSGRFLRDVMMVRGKRFAGDYRRRGGTIERLEHLTRCLRFGPRRGLHRRGIVPVKLDWLGLRGRIVAQLQRRLTDFRADPDFTNIENLRNAARQRGQVMGYEIDLLMRNRQRTAAWGQAACAKTAIGTGQIGA